MTIWLAPKAHADLMAIAEYIAKDNPGAARRMLQRFDRCFELLEQFPELGPAHSEIRPGLRTHTVRPYIVAYQRIGDGVEVMRVLHSARNWRALL